MAHFHRKQEQQIIRKANEPKQVLFHLAMICKHRMTMEPNNFFHLSLQNFEKIFISRQNKISLSDSQYHVFTTSATHDIFSTNGPTPYLLLMKGISSRCLPPASPCPTASPRHCSLHQYNLSPSLGALGKGLVSAQDAGSPPFS